MSGELLVYSSQKYSYDELTMSRVVPGTSPASHSHIHCSYI